MSAANDFSTGEHASSFQGFESLDANYIYCPNQFFDVCLRHCSRGTIRTIAFVLVETLRWRDKDGNPIQQEIDVSFKRLIEHANVSRGGIAGYLQEAVDNRFLSCVREGRRRASNQTGQTAAYALRWDYADQYVRDLQNFGGFFAGEGNRSPVPLEYFTRVIPQETLAVAWIVGVVLRHTVGYSNQFGRRPQAPLSYSFIQKYTGIKDRGTIADGIKRALEMNYIMCTEAGVFDQDAAKQRAATYAVKWLAPAKGQEEGSKNQPDPQFKNPTSDSVQKSDQDAFKNSTSNSSATPPEKASNYPTTRKKASKDTDKQQTAVVAVLIEQGFSQREATRLAENFGEPMICQQIKWLSKRKPTSNPTGMLRRAIEENWSEPTPPVEDATRTANSLKSAELSVLAGQAGEQAEQQRLAKKAQREQLKKQWDGTPREIQQQAAMRLLEQTSDPLEKSKILDYSFTDPPFAYLLALDQHLGADRAAA